MGWGACSCPGHGYLRLITDEKERVALWLLERLPDITDLPGGYWCIGVERDGALVGGVMFTNYRPCKGGGDIEMACAGHNWISRRVIQAAFDHPFRELRCNRVTAVVRKTNSKSRALLTGLGFVPEGKIREGYGPRQHGMIYGLLARDWQRSRFNKDSAHGQKHTTGT